MIEDIISLIPEHRIYVEPLCGPSPLLFHKPQIPKEGYIEILNDPNSLIVNFFKVLREDSWKLAKHLSLMPYSEEEYAKSVEICKEPEWYSDFEKAVYFYINLHQGFPEKVNGGWNRSIFSDGQAAMWERARNLFPLIQRMGPVHIANQAPVTIIDQYDSPDTFFYLPEADDSLMEKLTECQGSAIVGIDPDNLFSKLVKPVSDWDF